MTILQRCLQSQLHKCINASADIPVSSSGSVLLGPELQEASHSSDLPLVRFPDVGRLRINVFDTIAIPVMSRPRDQIARILVATNSRLGCQVRVIAQIEPNIRAAVNQGQVLSLDVPAAIFVVVVQFRRLRDAVMLASREGPCTPKTN